MKPSRMTAGSLAAVATVLCTLAAYAALDDPLFKLLASDGAEGEWFGLSIAIDGTKAIVGAPGEDGDILTLGAAYIYDTTTAQQLFKLIPNDVESDDQFDFSGRTMGAKVGHWRPWMPISLARSSGVVLDMYFWVRERKRDQYVWGWWSHPRNGG